MLYLNIRTSETRGFRGGERGTLERRPVRAVRGWRWSVSSCRGGSVCQGSNALFQFVKGSVFKLKLDVKLLFDHIVTAQIHHVTHRRGPDPQVGNYCLRILKYTKNSP